MIIVSDRGTVGLGGPLRAGVRPAGGDRPDFVQFIRNIGEPSDHLYGGGTYGFGKGIFFRLSRASTVLVDTKTSTAGYASRRLMCTSLGRSWYDDHDIRYTGRHWWGEVLDDVPDPILDDDAGSVAARLGLPGFGDDESGTDVAIIDADLGTSWIEDDDHPRTREQAAKFVVSAMLWHLWPKASRHDDDDTTMTLGAAFDGQFVPMPTPESHHELRPFVESLQTVRRGQGVAYRRTVPPREAGVFAHQICPATTPKEPTDDVIALARPFVGALRHIARMRVAELVVDYVAGPPYSDPLFAYAGVFKATPHADSYFAIAEPPTHDSWIDRGLSGTARGVVQGARRFIGKQMDEIVASQAVSSDSEVEALGAIGARLSELIPGGIVTPTLVPRRPSIRAVPNVASGDPPQWSRDGHGNDVGPTGRKGSGQRPRAARQYFVEAPRLLVADGRPFLVGLAHIEPSPSARIVSAYAFIVLDSGAVESEAPEGSLTPRVLEWRRSSDKYSIAGSELSVPSNTEGDWWVFAEYVPDAVVRLQLTAETLQ